MRNNCLGHCSLSLFPQLLHICYRCNIDFRRMRGSGIFIAIILWLQIAGIDVRGESDVTASDAQCERYAASCITCANAPSAFNCGYCADGAGRCTVGTIDGPTNGTCLPTSWSFAACNSLQTVADPCDAYGTSCDTCLNASTSLRCGYCNDYPGRCLSGTSGGPFSSGCSAHRWAFGSDSTCPVATCSYANCSDCADAMNAGNGCGWCRSSGSCMPANGLGPAIGYWCDDALTNQCSPPPPTPPHDDDDDDDDYPAAGTGSFVCMAAVLILILVQFVLLSCKPCIPVPRAAAEAGDSGGSTCIPSNGFFFLFTLASLGLKIAALLLDRWDASTATDPSNDGSMKMTAGFLGISTWRGTAEVTYMPYPDLCSSLANTPGFSYPMCVTLRAAAIITFIYGVLSAACGSFIIHLFAYFCLTKRSLQPSTHLILWRGNALASILSFASLFTWLGSAHFVLQWLYPRAVHLGPSWFLMLAAMILDALLRIAYRFALLAMPAVAINTQPLLTTAPVNSPTASSMQPHEQFHRSSQQQHYVETHAVPYQQLQHAPSSFVPIHASASSRSAHVASASLPRSTPPPSAPPMHLAYSQPMAAPIYGTSGIPVTQPYLPAPPQPAYVPPVQYGM